MKNVGFTRSHFLLGTAAGLAGCSSATSLPLRTGDMILAKPPARTLIADATTAAAPAVYSETNVAMTAVAGFDPSGTLLGSFAVSPTFSRFTTADGESHVFDSQNNFDQDGWLEVNGLTAWLGVNSLGQVGSIYYDPNGAIVTAMYQTEQDIYIVSDGTVQKVKVAAATSAVAWTGDDDFHPSAKSYASNAGFDPAFVCKQSSSGGGGDGSNCPKPSGDLDGFISNLGFGIGPGFVAVTGPVHGLVNTPTLPLPGMDPDFRCFLAKAKLVAASLATAIAFYKAAEICLGTVVGKQYRAIVNCVIAAVSFLVVVVGVVAYLIEAFFACV